MHLKSETSEAGSAIAFSPPLKEIFPRGIDLLEPRDPSIPTLQYLGIRPTTLRASVESAHYPRVETSCISAFASGLLTLGYSPTTI